MFIIFFVLSFIIYYMVLSVNDVLEQKFEGFEEKK